MRELARARACKSLKSGIGSCMETDSMMTRVTAVSLRSRMCKLWKERSGDEGSGDHGSTHIEGACKHSPLEITGTKLISTVVRDMPPVHCCEGIPSKASISAPRDHTHRPVEHEDPQWER